MTTPKPVSVKKKPRTKAQRTAQRRKNAETAHKQHALSTYEPHFALLMEVYFARGKGIDVKQRANTGKNGAAKVSSRSSRVSPDFPTMAGFALSIGATKDTLKNWAAAVDKDGQPAHPDFAIAYERANYRQEDLLINETLKGGYQPYFANMVAMNLLNWSTSANNKLSGDPEKPIVIREEYSASAALTRTRELLGALANGDGTPK